MFRRSQKLFQIAYPFILKPKRNLKQFDRISHPITREIVVIAKVNNNIPNLKKNPIDKLNIKLYNITNGLPDQDLPSNYNQFLINTNRFNNQNQSLWIHSQDIKVNDIVRISLTDETYRVVSYHSEKSSHQNSSYFKLVSMDTGNEIEVSDKSNSYNNIKIENLG